MVGPTDQKVIVIEKVIYYSQLPKGAGATLVRCQRKWGEHTGKSLYGFSGKEGLR